MPDLADAGAGRSPEGAITDPDDIYPSLVGTFTYDGTWYCPPKDFSTLGLVYNVDMLEDAASSHRRPGGALAAAAEALTTDGVVGLLVRPNLDRVGTFLLANGGYIVNDDVSEMTLDTEENRDTLQYLADMFAAGHADLRISRHLGRGEAFGHGKAAMVIEGNWLVGTMAQGTRTSTGPSPRCPKVPLDGPPTPSRSATPSAESANPDAAWAAIDFLTGPEVRTGGLQRDALRESL